MKTVLFSLLFISLFLEFSYAKTYKFSDLEDNPQFTSELAWRNRVDELKAGDTLLFEDKSLRLGAEVSNEGAAARVFRLQESPNQIIKIAKNPFNQLEVLSLDKEAKNLAILKQAGVDVPTVYQKSKNGHFLVKEYIEGETLYTVFEKLPAMKFEEKRQFFKSLAETFHKIEAAELFPSDLSHLNVIYNKQKSYIIDPGLLTDEALYLNPIKMSLVEFSPESFIYKMEEAYLNKKIPLGELEFNRLIEKYSKNFDNMMDLFYGVNVPESEKLLSKPLQEVFLKKSGKFNREELYTKPFGESRLEKMEQAFFHKVLPKCKTADEYAHYLQTIKELKREKNLRLVLIDNSAYFSALNPTPDQIELFKNLSGSYPTKASRCMRSIALSVLNK